MSGTFIVSLDCEGKWGMADHLQPYHHSMLTDRALAEVYDRLVALFARYDIAATFAYVMAFTLAESERRDFAELDDRSSGDPWLRHYWAHRDAGRSEGWFQPHALDAVRADGRHEIACHSFCHRPMGDASLPPAGARAELASAARVGALKKVEMRTFIFPRNEVGNLAALREAGYLGYRERLERAGGLRGRFTRLVEELNVRPAIQRPAAPREGLLPIPAGYFFNWRFAARRYVPAAVTRARWRSLLERTAAAGGVAHLWLHPHNLITAPKTGDSLEQVLADAARLRDRGLLEVRTQESYCRARAASAA